jgi:2-polyprenyl-3-methyl-5-hydroxy-6-metoxy-1,4-benzoquinol methylase
MALSKRTADEVQTAHRYFGSFADDYHRAFEGAGANPLHHLINKLFRRQTFVRRTEHVERLLREYGVAGKTVLDLGCGSGEVSIVAARLGARVIGLDIVDDMVAIARREAASAGVADRTEFRVANILEDAVPQVDVTMMVGVIEYYSDLDALLARVCAATRGRLIICDTRGPWWRRRLRYLLARAKHFYIFYRSPDAVAAIAARNGFTEQQRILGHSFTVFAFDRS